MIGKKLNVVGLFLASFAAFALGLGQPHAAAAGAVDLSRIENLMDTQEGRAALARAGVSAEGFTRMLAGLSPEQRRTIAEMAGAASPEARLGARMTAEGYTQAEISERLALLSNDEIARLADDPEATSSGTGVSTVILVLCLALVVVLVGYYFMFFEPEPPPPPDA